MVCFSLVLFARSLCSFNVRMSSTGGAGNITRGTFLDNNNKGVANLYRGRATIGSCSIQTPGTFEDCIRKHHTARIAKVPPGVDPNDLSHPILLGH